MELHRGIDLRAPVGTPVLAVCDGVIAGMWSEAEGGLCLRIAGHSPDGNWPDPNTYFFQTANSGGAPAGAAALNNARNNHDDSGWRITYCHLNNYGPNVNLGAVVRRGDVLAFSGATGSKPDGTPVAPHLHIVFEWLQDGLWDSRTFVNPQLLLGNTISGQVPYNTLPPGRFVAQDQALILPANAPASQAKPSSVVINVDGNGVASVNMGQGASLAGNVNIPMTLGR